MFRPGLEALIAPHSLNEFLFTAWPKRPFVVHGLDTSVRPLLQIPALLSPLESVLTCWSGQIQAHLPDVKDESSSISVGAEDARKLYACGMGLLFNNAQTAFPKLNMWLQAIGHDLGLPNSTYARSILYATPDGKGTATHFDQNINFVLQLHGVKKWRVAPNASVENPTERFTIGQPMDPELASYVGLDEMPVAMPIDFQEIELRPGSMLFVPRGYWHSTEASGQALALNFTFSQPAWVDLFLLALRSRLVLSPDWRELADGVRSVDESRRLKARAHLDALLFELADDIPNWRAEDILGATEGM